VLRDADIAMYSAKAQGRARYEVFEPSMRVKITDNLTLETELRQALECGEFLLNYQPIVSLENNRLTGFEALLRWQHPTRGLLFPGDFLSVAEDTGLIIPIDRWVLRTACQQVKNWQELYSHDPPLTISVNLTGKQIAQLDFVEFIEQALEESGLPPLSLKLEVTESDLMENTKSTIDVFKRLRTIGVQIQVDDFGIGYSSLSYLSQFPVTALKIDQSFINKMMLDGNQLKIVQAIVMLTQRLDVVVVAEGVENEAQLRQLREMGCEFGQGYYLSRPLDAESAHRLLEEIASRQGMLEGVL